MVWLLQGSLVLDRLVVVSETRYCAALVVAWSPRMQGVVGSVMEKGRSKGWTPSGLKYQVPLHGGAKSHSLQQQRKVAEKCWGGSE